MTTALAVDLGSSSGRVVAGRLEGDHIEIHEVHRFSHEAIRRDGSLVWDLEPLKVGRKPSRNIPTHNPYLWIPGASTSSRWTATIILLAHHAPTAMSARHAHWNNSVNALMMKNSFI